ncbi:acyltransferase [Parvularcula marina]|uniref:Acyltransferase n=1 Tax=Parvularcula marina TaxID=2292771 RepID=A0A371RGD4_9PROT|nr:acyltransferase [Parvularcula marina]RFB04499.1 acyltransferase [Parvularcula marina]
MSLAVPVRAVSHILHRIAVTLRLVWYNLTCFVFFRPLPFSTTIYGRIRLLHRPCRLKIGRNCRIGDDTYFATSLTSTIEWGDDVTVNMGCVFVAIDSIRIGKNTAIAEYVSFRDQAHEMAEGRGVRGQGYKSGPIEVGENVWIGRGAYIGAGTQIGNDCVVGANSVVHGTFPPGVLIAGAPARVRKVLIPSPEADAALAEAREKSAS